MKEKGGKDVTHLKHETILFNITPDKDAVVDQSTLLGLTSATKTRLN